jgi:hypothetical protein
MLVSGSPPGALPLCLNSATTIIQMDSIPHSRKSNRTTGQQRHSCALKGSASRQAMKKACPASINPAGFSQSHTPLLDPSVDTSCSVTYTGIADFNAVSRVELEGLVA